MIVAPVFALIAAMATGANAYIFAVQYQRLVNPVSGAADRNSAAGFTVLGMTYRSRAFELSLGSPVHDRVDEGLSLADRVAPRRTDTDRHCSALSDSPLPTSRVAHLNDREAYAAMFHGEPPLTCCCV
ncbi:hypothetical protein [Bradyrhizobium glycinis]|uniref:hypothetical protein n=1 Tax=Bradyrhizobium glycinis TaxID=2751812 RepID=UPI0018D702A5|nr:hypothetical protein [Bradyrhizobium glycinis]MBH5372189.1 hypothetical protein [Bradyrhizobium glycinis]